MRNALYDESQGIIDIAVKLYAMAQIKAITDGTEIVTIKVIKEVAGEELRFVKKMLDALRTGDVKKLAQYDDIRPIDIEKYLARQMARIGATAPDFSKDGMLTLEEEAVLRLLEMDIPSNIARKVVRKVIGKSSTGQPLSSVVKKAFKLALNMETDSEQAEMVEQVGDLRNNTGDSHYENLKNSGVIASDMADEF